jgi:hypothetical protein
MGRAWRRTAAPESAPHLLSLVRGHGLSREAGKSRRSREFLVWHMANDGRISVCEDYRRPPTWNWVVLSSADASATIVDEGSEFLIVH